MTTNPKQLKLTFASGTGTATGANFLIERLPDETGKGLKILFDCGLTQGSKMADPINWNPFSYDAKEVDILIISHAHVDHVGLIPKLYHEGFRGRILSIDATRDIARYMLEDTVNILKHDNTPGLDEIYNHEAVDELMKLWEGFTYHQEINLEYGFTIRFLDSGHILGSAMTEVTYNGKKLLYTGDLGNSPSVLLRDTEQVSDIDYLVMESVYGDRNHEGRAERRNNLKKVLLDNFERKGALVMPTFSLERTQELLFEIDTMMLAGEIPKMSVYLDSPLAIRLTKVFRHYDKYYNDVATKRIKSGDDIFSFPGLKVTTETQESINILHAPMPKVIIAGSGMSQGGRIIHHEHNYITNPNNIILLTGYQTAGSLGRLIDEGVKNVKIAGDELVVKAEVRKIIGYSGHKDCDSMVDWIEPTVKNLKKLFIVLGEPKSSSFLAQKMHDTHGLDVSVPQRGESVMLDF